MDNKYKFGLILGRFQTFHKGHEDIINRALDVCNKVGIFIGSSQESNTVKNPFSYELRKDVIQRVYGDKVMVEPLVDIGVGNNCKWGEYVLEQAKKQFNTTPDIFISGKEDRRTSWLDSEEGKTIAELFVPKSIEISASELRQMIIDNKKELWQTYMNPKLWDLYDEFRTGIINSLENIDTKSI